MESLVTFSRRNCGKRFRSTSTISSRKTVFSQPLLNEVVKRLQVNLFETRIILRISSYPAPFRPFIQLFWKPFAIVSFKFFVLLPLHRLVGKICPEVKGVLQAKIAFCLSMATSLHQLLFLNNKGFFLLLSLQAIYAKCVGIPIVKELLLFRGASPLIFTIVRKEPYAAKNSTSFVCHFLSDFETITAPLSFLTL